jgi:sialate O-acetylesterase
MKRILASAAILLSLAVSAFPLTQNDVLSIRDGQFHLDGKPFTEISFNKFDLLWQLYDQLDAGHALTARNPMVKAQDKALCELNELGFRTIRIFALPWRDRGNAAYADPGKRKRLYEALDKTVALCDRHGMRVVWSLGCGDFTDVKRDAAGKWQYEGDHYRELISDPESKGRQRLYRYIDETVNRYKGDKTVLMWEIGNEITLHADIGKDHVYNNQRMPTLKDVAGFYDDVARRIKAADPLRLVNNGGSHMRECQWNIYTGNGWKKDTLEEQRKCFELLFADTAVDVIDLHSYPNNKPAYEISDGAGGKAWIGPPQWMAIAKGIDKPLMIGEFGALPFAKSKEKIWKETPDYFESYADLAAAKPWVEKTLNDVIDAGVQLSYWWCYQSDRPVEQNNPQRFDLTIGRNPELVALIADANKRLQAKLTPSLLQLPVCFTDNMVLQRNRPVAIWGDATPGSEITVSFARQTVKTQADRDGKWRAKLDPMPASGEGRTLTIHSSIGNYQSSFDNVLVGEVWLAGGQSNMAFGLGGHRDSEKHLPKKDNPLIRILHVPVTEFGPVNRDRTNWVVCGPKSTPRFSAVAYFFATELQRRLGVPIGIIGSYRGGTWNENWMTPASIKDEPKLKYLFEKYEDAYGEFEDEADYEEAYQEFRVKLKEWQAKGGWSHGPVPTPPVGPKSSRRPSGLYECMIKPLQPYTIKGVIWYQGEGNSWRYDEFRTLFPAFIEGWRKTWENPELPFYFVQLPPFKAEQWPRFRQAQLDCAKAIPHCGMVVAEGCGDLEDIHPKVKKPIGERLAQAACVEQYGQAGPAYGPMCKSVERRGHSLIVTFDYVGSGLVCKGEQLSSFGIAGEDSEFVKADARIAGNTIEVSSKDVAEPESVRYAYAPFPVMDLFNRDGLPASPFTMKLTHSKKDR